MEVKNTTDTYFPKNIERISVNPIQPQAHIEQEDKEIQEKITKEMLLKKVEDLNEFIEPTTTAVKFKLHEKLNVYYVQVIDTYTEEILKEIPQKKFLDMYASRAAIMGLIVDEKS